MDEFLNKAVIVEYIRKNTPHDQLCTLISYPSAEFIKIKNKDGNFFLIPTRKIENIKLLGIARW